MLAALRYFRVAILIQISVERITRRHSRHFVAHASIFHRSPASARECDFGEPPMR
jgi:hypothetical protein